MNMIPDNKTYKLKEVCKCSVQRASYFVERVFMRFAYLKKEGQPRTRCFSNFFILHAEGLYIDVYSQVNIYTGR